MVSEETSLVRGLCYFGASCELILKNFSVLVEVAFLPRRPLLHFLTCCHPRFREISLGLGGEMKVDFLGVGDRLGWLVRHEGEVWVNWQFKAFYLTGAFSSVRDPDWISGRRVIREQIIGSVSFIALDRCLECADNSMVGNTPNTSSLAGALLFRPFFPQPVFCCSVFLGQCRAKCLGLGRLFGRLGIGSSFRVREDSL